MYEKSMFKWSVSPALARDYVTGCAKSVRLRCKLARGVSGNEDDTETQGGAVGLVPLDSFGVADVRAFGRASLHTNMNSKMV